MSLQLIPPDINLDFVGKRHFFVILSTAINLAAILLLIFKGLNYGVDFIGGSVVQVQFASATNADTIRRSLAPLPFTSPIALPVSPVPVPHPPAAGQWPQPPPGRTITGHTSASIRPAGDHGNGKG